MRKLLLTLLLLTATVHAAPHALYCLGRLDGTDAVLQVSYVPREHRLYLNGDIHNIQGTERYGEEATFIMTRDFYSMDGNLTRLDLAIINQGTDRGIYIMQIRAKTYEVVAVAALTCHKYRN